MSRSDRVDLARGQVVVEARRFVEANPGASAALEMALRRLYEAHRVKVDRLDARPEPSEAA